MMGTAVSRNLDIPSNEYCLKFVASEFISPNDPFWNRFLAFNITPPISLNDQLAFEGRIEPLCDTLLKNNLISGNLGSLVQLFLVRSNELLSATNSDAHLFNWQFFNMIFTIRCILKYLSETTTEDQLLQHVEYKTSGNTFELFLGSLVSILVDVPINNSTYLIHLEAVHCLLIVLSVQFHSGKRSDQSNVYRLIMRGKHVIHAPVLVKTLLMNFINQAKLPPGYGDKHSNSFVLGIASDLWSMLSFNKKPKEDLVSLDECSFQDVPLATQSLLLVLILAHHWTTKTNPFRSCLFSCLNNQDTNPTPPVTALSIFKIDFELLYTALCKQAYCDEAILLLYTMIYQNSAFKTYLLRRSDLDQLILPILKTLYNAPNSNSHHIYMSLIILLILSEDDSFNNMVHEKKLQNIGWYTERSLSEISLGGLLILIVIRTVQYNMLKMRDKYLHTNCLATLANMSAKFRDLHPYVSQRLVSLFGTLAKKYYRLAERLKGTKSKNDEVTINVNQNTTDLEQDVYVLEEVLRMILEILNSCFSAQLMHNPNLIYTLLYNKHIFEPFSSNVIFQDVIHNIDVIIKYFSQLLSEHSQQYDVDTRQILDIIHQGTKNWPKEKLTKLPDLKFKYVEEDQPEDFFIPYVWVLVSRQSVLHWTGISSPVLTTVC